MTWAAFGNGFARMLFAVIPAAGQSVRMGRPKLSLPVGNRTVIEWTIDSLRRLPKCEVVVVFGPHNAELAPLVAQAGASPLMLRQPSPDMRTSVVHGLEWIENRFHPSRDDLWLLCPADHPIIDRKAVELLVHSAEGAMAKIFVPVFGGRRGHPALIRWSVTSDIRELQPECGLNVLFRRQATQTLEISVDSDTVLFDLDTPEDYAALQARMNLDASSPH